jgi:hypothetical protein
MPCLRGRFDAAADGKVFHSPAPMPIISIRYRPPNRQATPIMSLIIVRPSCERR